MYRLAIKYTTDMYLSKSEDSQFFHASFRHALSVSKLKLNNRIIMHYVLPVLDDHQSLKICTTAKQKTQTTKIDLETINLKPTFFWVSLQAK